MEFVKAKNLYRLLLPIVAAVLTTIIAVAAVTNDASEDIGEPTDSVIQTEPSETTLPPDEFVGETLPDSPVLEIPVKPLPEPEPVPQEPPKKYSDNAKINAFILERLDKWICPVRANYKPITGIYAFGAIRNGGSRRHAGLDFVAPHGTPVYAVTSGTVRDVSGFYEGTLAVEVLNDDGSVLRYCEIGTNLRVGDKVKQGDQIGFIKRAYSGTAMLHMEVYYGDEEGYLTQPWNSVYKYVKVRYLNRRSDIIDPTFLKDLKKFVLPNADKDLFADKDNDITVKH
jgi:murein DD-endopeptidase MepM/ murein hydrolase activator NlpD